MAGTPVFSTPGDYSAQQADIERQRRVAEMLQQQSMEPLQTNQTAGGFVLPVSPYAGLAKALQGYAGMAGQKRATEREQGLNNQYRADLQDTLSRAMQAGAGTPARPAMQDPQELQQQADQGTAPPAPIAAAGPDPERAASILMGHPATQALGQQQLMQDMSRKALIAALQGPQAQAAPPTAPQGQPQAPGAAPAPSAPTPAPQGPAPGGPAGGVPMAVWLQTDPSGKSYIEQLAKEATERSKPTRFNAGGGVITGDGRVLISAPDANGRLTTYGPNGPTVGLAPGTEPATTALHDIPKPDAPQVQVPMSGGQTVTLTQPEYLEYTRSGQMPARYGTPASAPNAQTPTASPNPVAAPQRRSSDRQRILTEELAGEQARLQTAQQQGNAPLIEQATKNIAALQREIGSAGGGLGTPGLTQSQGDLINQERQRAGGKAVDEVFAKDYTSFVQGGAADATKQLAQLGDVVKALQSPNPNLSGPVLGRVPDSIKSFTNPQAIAMRERVEEVVQRSLRAILGAQFTEKEGERLIARAYNPSQPEAENAIRVQRLFTQLEQSLQAKTDAAKYFEANGTLQGWSGKLPALADFDAAVAGAQGSGGKIGAPAKGIPSGVDPKLWQVMTPQEKALWQ